MTGVVPGSPQAAANTTHLGAGHSIEVLLRVHAKCIDGQEEAALLRIDAALRQL